MKKLTRSIEKHQEVWGKSDYNAMFGSMERNPRLNKIIQSMENYPNRGSFLDIGCGDGSFGIIMSSIGYTVTGLESDKELVKIAQKKGMQVKRVSFLERLPFRDSSFDVVFAGEVIEHTIDDDYFLTECYRVLRGNGIFILTTPNLLSLGNRIRMVFGLLPTAYQPYHYRIYNFRLITDKMKKAGFHIKQFISTHVIISRYLNTWYAKLFGSIGEMMGTWIPKMGEQFILYAKK